MPEPPLLFTYHLQQGEGQYVEFKSARQGKPGSQTKRPVKDILKNIAETLIAFANAEGGVLYLGVEDDKTISGIHHGENEIAELKTGFIKLIQNSRDFPLQSAYSFQVDGKVVLTYEIKNIRLQPFQLTDGRCLKRIKDESRPYPAVRIIQSKEEDDSREFDGQYCNNATEKDLDWERVEKVGAQRYPGISAKDFLNIQNLAEYGPGKMLFRNACLLLFGLKERIPYLFPKSSIRLIRVDGHKLLPGKEYNVLRQDEFMGNIFYLLEDIWQEYKKFFIRNEVLGPDILFERNFILPDSILKECLVNAVAHRCYKTASDIKVYRYSDEVEFNNPGKLPSFLTLDALYQDDSVQFTRNTLIAKTLRQCGVMRELGEGLLRIKKVAQETGITPVFRSNHSYFSVKFVLTNEKLEMLKKDMEQTIYALHKDNIPLAKDIIRKLIQSGFYGIKKKDMKEEMWKKLQDELDNILRITASYPTLHDERKGFRQWRDRLMEMEDGD